MHNVKISFNCILVSTPSCPSCLFVYIFQINVHLLPHACYIPCQLDLLHWTLSFIDDECKLCSSHEQIKSKITFFFVSVIIESIFLSLFQLKIQTFALIWGQKVRKAWNFSANYCVLRSVYFHCTCSIGCKWATTLLFPFREWWYDL